MKRRLLLSAVVWTVAATAMAQKDVTPSRYKFADQPVGLYTIDEALTGANPANNYAPAVSKFNGGYIMMNNGQFTSMTADPVVAILTGTSVADLGGEVGKVLCIKGKNSKFPAGIASEKSFGPGWWNMSLFTGSTDIAVDQKVRFSIVLKIVENLADVNSATITFDAYTYANNNYFTASNPIPKPAYKSGDFIERWEDDGSPKEDDNGNYIYKEDLWKQCEFDFFAGNEAGIPLRLAIAFAAQNPKFDNSAVLIRSITMTTDPSGDPVSKDVILKSGNLTGISAATNDANQALQYTCNQNVVNFNNLSEGQKVEIYSVNGQLVASFVANGSEHPVALDKGFYVARSGSAVAKLGVK